MYISNLNYRYVVSIKVHFLRKYYILQGSAILKGHELKNRRGQFEWQSAM